VRVERRVLTGRKEIGRETERALTCQRDGGPVRSREHMELRRARRPTERDDDATARRVVVETVDNAVVELPFADEHAIDGER